MASGISKFGVLAAALALAGAASLSGCADLPEITGKEKLSSAAPSGKLADAGEVYLLRGGFNIFSTGMDELAEWEQVAADARQHYVANHAPIILVGHSWGVPGAVLVARELARTGTPVALMVFYDSTDSMVIPANVKRVVNLRSKAAMGAHLTVTGGYGFAGSIETEDRPEYGHLNLDNAPVLHEETIAQVLQVLQKPKPRR
jgi:hypothetical protein